MTNSKKPFKDKKFYLDLRFYRSQDELIKNLKKFGGKVESFLSREVTHVITDRLNLIQKQEPWLPATPKSLISSPRHPNSYDSILGHFDTPVNTSSSPLDLVNTTTPNPALSRGLALVQKAKQKHQGTTDLLGVCNQWGIKVVQLKKVLLFINKHLCSTNNDENHYTKVNRVDQLKFVPEKLSPPFIKIEDGKRSYRPNYKVFKTWKDVCDPDIWRIANRLKSQIQESQERNALRPIQIHNILNSDSHSRDSVLSAIPSPRQSQVAFSFGNSSKMISVPVNYSTDKIKHDRNTPKPKGKNTEKKALPKKRYCEICICTFINLEEHLMSKKHREYVLNSSNYLTLKRIIAKLPSVTDFLKKHKLKSSRNRPVQGKPVSVKQTLTNYVTGPEVSMKIEQDLDVLVPDKPEAENEIIPASCSTEEMSYKSDTIPYFNSVDFEAFKTTGAIDLSGRVDKIHSYSPKSETKQVDIKCVNDQCIIDNASQKGILNENNTSILYNAAPNELGLLAPVIEKMFVIKPNETIEGCESGYEEGCNTFIPDAHLPNPVLNTGSQCVVRAYPFTNFGFGWSGNSIPGAEHCLEGFDSTANFAVTGAINYTFNNVNVEGKKESDSDFQSSSELTNNWKEIHNEINTVCRSLETRRENALDLSTSKHIDEALVYQQNYVPQLVKPIHHDLHHEIAMDLCTRNNINIITQPDHKELFVGPNKPTSKTVANGTVLDTETNGNDENHPVSPQLTKIICDNYSGAIKVNSDEIANVSEKINLKTEHGVINNLNDDVTIYGSDKNHTVDIAISDLETSERFDNHHTISESKLDQGDDDHANLEENKEADTFTSNSKIVQEVIDYSKICNSKPVDNLAGIDLIKTEIIDNILASLSLKNSECVDHHSKTTKNVSVESCVAESGTNQDNTIGRILSLMSEEEVQCNEGVLIPDSEVNGEDNVMNDCEQKCDIMVPDSEGYVIVDCVMSDSESASDYEFVDVA